MGVGNQPRRLQGATGRVVTMKWVVVSFDEDSKLYTVQNENGRTCRATLMRLCMAWRAATATLKRWPREKLSYAVFANLMILIPHSLRARFAWTVELQQVSRNSIARSMSARALRRSVSFWTSSLSLSTITNKQKAPGDSGALPMAASYQGLTNGPEKFYHARSQKSRLFTRNSNFFHNFPESR